MCAERLFPLSSPRYVLRTWSPCPGSDNKIQVSCSCMEEDATSLGGFLAGQTLAGQSWCWAWCPPRCADGTGCALSCLLVCGEFGEAACLMSQKEIPYPVVWGRSGNVLPKGSGTTQQGGMQQNRVSPSLGCMTPSVFSGAGLLSLLCTKEVAPLNHSIQEKEKELLNPQWNLRLSAVGWYGTQKKKNNKKNFLDGCYNARRSCLQLRWLPHLAVDEELSLVFCEAGFNSCHLFYLKSFLRIWTKFSSWAYAEKLKQFENSFVCIVKGYLKVKFLSDCGLQCAVGCCWKPLIFMSSLNEQQCHKIKISNQTRQTYLLEWEISYRRERWELRSLMSHPDSVGF